MKAIINCGGRGTRIPDISKNIPKPMVDINGKPLLFWIINNLKEYGVNNLYITLHHLPEKITDYFMDGRKFGVSIEYSYEKYPLGTGGALLAFKHLLIEDTFILYGDVLTNINFKKLMLFHKKHHSFITATIHPSSHPEDSDLIKCDAENILQKILKKPHKSLPQNPYNLAALYVFSPNVVPILSLTPPFDIAHDLLPYALQLRKKIFCYNTDEFIQDIGTKERLKKAQKIYKA